jgi:hypothetical protein
MAVVASGTPIFLRAGENRYLLTRVTPTQHHVRVNFTGSDGAREVYVAGHDDASLRRQPCVGRGPCCAAHIVRVQDAAAHLACPADLRAAVVAAATAVATAGDHAATGIRTAYLGFYGELTLTELIARPTCNINAQNPAGAGALRSGPVDAGSTAAALRAQLSGELAAIQAAAGRSSTDVPVTSAPRPGPTLDELDAQCMLSVLDAAARAGGRSDGAASAGKRPSPAATMGRRAGGHAASPALAPAGDTLVAVTSASLFFDADGGILHVEPPCGDDQSDGADSWLLARAAASTPANGPSQRDAVTSLAATLAATVTTSVSPLSMLGLRDASFWVEFDPSRPGSSLLQQAALHPQLFAGALAEMADLCQQAARTRLAVLAGTFAAPHRGQGKLAGALVTRPVPLSYAEARLLAVRVLLPSRRPKAALAGCRWPAEGEVIFPCHLQELAPLLGASGARVTVAQFQLPRLGLVARVIAAGPAASAFAAGAGALAATPSWLADDHAAATVPVAPAHTVATSAHTVLHVTWVLEVEELADVGAPATQRAQCARASTPLTVVAAGGGGSATIACAAPSVFPSLRVSVPPAAAGMAAPPVGSGGAGSALLACGEWASRAGPVIVEAAQVTWL